MKPFTFDRFIRLLIVLALCWVAWWLLGILKNVLLPFALASLLAYIMEPLVEFNQRLMHTRKRGVAVMVTLLDVTLILTTLFYFLTPLVEDEIKELGGMISSYSLRNIRIPMVPESIFATIEDNIDLKKIWADIESGKWSTWLNTGGTLVSGSIDFVMHSIEWLLTFVYIIFIMIDYKRLGEGFRMMVPDEYKKTVFRIVGDVKHSMNEYFRGQLLIASCAALFYCIGFSIVGLPMAIIMGITVGILFI
ncbi:MAG: AI-2E family transporter, partial [Muribaculaceae bacterium]|nr:AI-2E family transporter [Muribaculaceae bacterium]